MQATVKYPRLAAMLIEIEKTGRTRAEIGRLAGRDGSAATRWAKGTHLPGWSAVKSLADAIRGDSPGLADGLLEAWHYYSDPVEPGSVISPALLAAIRKELPDPEDQQRVIEIFERRLRGEPPPSAAQQSEEEGESSDGRQAAS
jgi:hypothetical protein